MFKYQCPQTVTVASIARDVYILHLALKMGDQLKPLNFKQLYDNSTRQPNENNQSKSIRICVESVEPKVHDAGDDNA